MTTRLELIMKNNIFIFVICVSAYIPSSRATTDSETVWLKDVTPRFQTDKRTLSDPDLQDQLSFRLKRKSHVLTLNLRRNHNIDPNADIYIVRNLNDGRSILEKTENLVKESLAYYQDSDNGAFMTARCVKRSSGQCDILINGNIRIGDRHYDLRPSEDDITTRSFLETTEHFGKRYVLKGQPNIKRDTSEAETYAHEKNVQKKNTDRLHRFHHAKDKRKKFLQTDFRPSIRNIAGFHNKATRGYRRGTNNKDDIFRNLKKQYYVKLLVLTDASVWDLFITTVNSSSPATIVEETTERNIRRFYSHVINGVDQLYKGIDDPDMEIQVILHGFVIFRTESQFPHIKSRVESNLENKKINAFHYLNDIGTFDIVSAQRQFPGYSQIALFTRYTLYFEGKYHNGMSLKGCVCDIGQRVQITVSSDYFSTTSIAAHELGHSLGASHDGEDDAKECKGEDHFIMARFLPDFGKAKNYCKNPWLFSNCSVNAFKKLMISKQCLTKKPDYKPDKLDEWKTFMYELPGQTYTPNMQCHLINGPGSTYCQNRIKVICRYMYCTKPKTNQCINGPYLAAPGTMCGEDMWCIQGECVPKVPK